MRRIQGMRQGSRLSDATKLALDLEHYVQAPQDIVGLMNLYPQSVPLLPIVEYIPVMRRGRRALSAEGATHLAAT